MKKCILLVFMALTFELQAQNETYIVLEVRGKVICKTDSLILNLNKKIKGEHQFFAESPLDFARLWDIKRKTYAYIAPEKKDEEGAGWFSDGILTSKAYENHLANRANNDAISYLFIKNNRLWRNKEVEISLKPKDAKSYYFLQFDGDGKTFRNPLSVRDKKVIIDKSSLKMEEDNGSKLGSYARIGFLNGDNQKAIMLKGVVYAVVTLENVAEELSLLRSLLKEKIGDKATIDSKLEAYLKKNYGDEITLKDLQ